MPDKNKKQDDDYKNKKSQDKPADKAKETDKIKEKSKDKAGSKSPDKSQSAKAQSAKNKSEKPPTDTEDLLDESLEESFPASDPPSITRAPEDKRETRQPPPKEPSESARHKR